MLVAYLSLAVSVITLIIALLIHSETRDVLSHVNTITYTLPGAYDVGRLRNDIEKTGEIRGKVICVASKHTHIDWSMPAYSKVSVTKQLIRIIWRAFHNFANCFSGNVEIPVVAPPNVYWELKSGLITSSDLDKLIKQGWEPFSVTNDNKVWLRKEVIKKD